MNKKNLNNQSGVILPLIILVVFVVLAIVVYLTYQQNLPAISKLTGLNQASSGGKVETHPSSDAKITITANNLVPQTITVAKNQQITFVNTDSKSHQIISDNLSDNIDSDTLNTGDTYSYTFENTGTYQIHDRLNPLKIKGTVIVK